MIAFLLAMVAVDPDVKVVSVEPARLEVREGKISRIVAPPIVRLAGAFAKRGAFECAVDVVVLKLLDQRFRGFFDHKGQLPCADLEVSLAAHIPKWIGQDVPAAWCKGAGHTLVTKVQLQIVTNMDPQPIRREMAKSISIPLEVHCSN